MLDVSPQPQTPRLAVGDFVVYGSHGVGRVALREGSAAPKDQTEIVVIEFADGLTVRLPLERAVEYLRPLSSETELASVSETLRGNGSRNDDTWHKRLRTTRDKVSGGDAVSLAEVVRDGAQRGGGETLAGGPGRLSLTERQLYLKARRLLADEIQTSRGLDAAEADAWITDQLARTSPPGSSPR